MLKSSLKEWSAAFIKKHGNKFDLSKAVYNGTGKDITIICPDHGEYTAPASRILKSKNGCGECYRDRNITKENFVEKAKAIFGNLYDYSKVEFKEPRKPVIIICKIHGPFPKNPASHITGKEGCQFCGKNILNLNQFLEIIKKIHGDKLDFSNIKEYIGTKTKFSIKCKKGHSFNTDAGKLMYHKQGCKKCADEIMVKTQEQFIQEAIAKHGNKFDYSQTIYERANKKLIIICKYHGPFPITPGKHLRSRKGGCPSCSHFISEAETKWLNSLNIPNDKQHRQVYLYIDKKKYHIDGYDPINKIIYEFYGDYWHGNPKKYNPNAINKSAHKRFKTLYKNTLIREEELKSAGYNVVSIWESDWKKAISKSANKNTPKKKRKKSKKK